MTEQGVPKRQNTHIDIPDSLRLPHFMALDDAAEQETDGLSEEYKLVLQSVVCHRGDSLHSGHYIAFARVAPKLLTDNRRHDHDPPPDYEEAQWVRFDDLATDDRVSPVDDINQSLREEMPYLLFYQIVPMVDVTTTSTDGSVTEPPSYNDSAVNVPDRVGTPPAEVKTDRPEGISVSTSDYFDSSTTLVHTGPTIRFSSEIERPVRLSLDDDPTSVHLQVDNSRRGSVAFSESTAVTPSVNSEAPSPVVTPQDESTANRLSRAAAKFTKTGSKSRPTSQAGEGRMSLTMSRLGGLMVRSSKDPLSGVSGTEGLDEHAVATEDTEGKEKEHHHLHHHHHKKDRTKSKSREKDKGKQSGVPDRECAVM